MNDSMFRHGLVMALIPASDVRVGNQSVTWNNFSFTYACVCICLY